MNTVFRTTLLALLFLFVGSAQGNAQEKKKVYLKEFEFRLDQISEIQYENEYFVTITLNKNSQYLFEITNHIGDYKGEAVIEIQENEKTISKNEVGEKIYDKFQFKCTKTGYYDILITFKDNIKGNSIIKLYILA